MITSFKNFIDNLILENLHPELSQVINDKSGKVSMQTRLANKIRDLTNKGESTGIEGNMPKGSSRAYLKIKDPVHVTIDNKPATMQTGMKVAIRSSLDKHHNKKEHDDMSLGEMQNATEGGDHHVNSHHRVLTADRDGHYHSNEHGIFPPLIEHDHNTHAWSHVGHVSDVSKKQFRELTTTPKYPKGISHTDFVDALSREHNKSIGRYWNQSPEKEAHLDHVLDHPLVQNFNDYHSLFASSPIDYHQLKNMGAWKHPITGKEHIVARDHGFSLGVENAYSQARMKKSR